MAAPAPPDPAGPAHGRCLLRHPVFTRFGEVMFRPAEADGTPVMIFPLGGSTAAIPLHSLQHEFGLDADSPDGRMLGLVAQALDFVGELRPGDPLPLEVLDGGASWQPGAQHARIAEQRLRLQLVAAVAATPGGAPRNMAEGASEGAPCDAHGMQGGVPGNAPGNAPENIRDAAPAGSPGDGPASAPRGIPAADAPEPSWAAADPQAVLHAATAAGMTDRLQAAAVGAAALLGLPNAAAVSRLLAAAAAEMGFIEALRDRLMRRVGAMLARVDALGGSLGHNSGAVELLSRVRRLAGIAYDRIRARFTALEDCSSRVLDMLRDLDGWGRTVRLHRDWLYSSLRAWEGILVAWEGGSTVWSQDTWVLLRRTYRFLAPRFMPMQEWQLTTRAQRADAMPRVPMVW